MRIFMGWKEGEDGAQNDQMHTKNPAKLEKAWNLFILTNCSHA